MPLRLSDAEITAIERANTVLLAPFAYENGEVWRSAAARAVQECVGGDSSSFEMLVPGLPVIVSTSPETVQALKAVDPPPEWLVRALTVTRRQLGLTVSDWADLFDLRQLKRTAFYNETVRPHGLSAPLSLLEETGTGPMPAALTVYSSDERIARRHVERRKRLLRLLFPAYRAGLKTYFSHRQNGAALAALTEHAAIGVVFFDLLGHVGYENEFFQRLMESDPDRAAVRAEVSHLVRGMSSMPFDGNCVPNSMFQTRNGNYRISATVIDHYESPGAIRALALVQRITTAPLDAKGLAKQYSLTGREIEIAYLLRQGLATREMGTILGISVNTVRRHVEQIFLKLDVHTRTAVVARLTGAVS